MMQPSAWPRGQTGADMEEVSIVMIPFLGTSLGAALVFFLKAKMNPRLERLMLGFASGVMIAASVWSLLLPAIEMAEAQGKVAWLPAASGFLLGMGFLLLLGRLAPLAGRESKKQEGTAHLAENPPGKDMAAGKEMSPNNLCRSLIVLAGSPDFRNSKRTGYSQTVPKHKVTMLILAVALHNLPEGMAVGVALAGAMTENTGITMAGAMMLSVGIALQNLPEGAIISMPLRNVGVTRPRAFWYGVLSGAVEPVGAFATILLAEQLVPILPYLLAFAAGAMLYVVADELIPEAGAEGSGKIGTIGMAAGFVLMMVLDVAM